ncbi:thioredoxin domain-containing protein [Thiomicrorhabdus lithotrophica]|uniref:DUF255 domain-containing protein n=1 Tax=Thiomicrorhabdus lithotrophica TaxID=2949997 RepID=A0ABY8CA49_9GAMM|nr:DUF255 domain-containing protein [Thiomicrorhabdus lithotrophica]WEJ62855.1 DUF255 domain-containing protein [Thiomicrorhabdus lithotrophica]
MISTVIKQPKTKLPGLVTLDPFKILAIIFLSLFVPITSVQASNSNTASTNFTNILQNNNSSYLAMHGNDPVDWQLWNKAILKTAQQENKLVFISSGYFSCHWCHVMQDENYQNPETATYINKHFISVKIDRELNPELDKTLIEFAQKSTGQAGWPQHVILTPSGYPFASFIYLPNKELQKTLQRIVSLWTSRPTEIETLAQQFAKPEASNPNVKYTELTLTPQQFTQRLLDQVNQAKDDLSGGLKNTSKFPKAPLLNTLLSIDKLPEEIEEWLILTLDQMQSEHLFDHIHGGFYRYTVDPNWQTPHFEKMAYDNALLIQTYLSAGTRWQRQDYLDTAKMTLNYLQTHLYNPQTQLYLGSQSAIDKNSLEGGDYLWSKRQLQAKLTDSEFDLIQQAWLLDSAPPYELGWHPSPILSKNTWQIIRQKLQIPPTEIPTDTKGILGWNGLVLSALSQAYQTFKTVNYLTQAKQLASKLSTNIQLQNAPRAIVENNQLIGEANIQDYAFIKKGLRDYQDATKDTQFETSLIFIKQKLVQDFYSSTGWQYGATPILPQQKGEWLMEDGPIPSPAALVSCLKPNSVIQDQNKLLAQAINYPSYLDTLECIQQQTNLVK